MFMMLLYTYFGFISKIFGITFISFAIFQVCVFDGLAVSVSSSHAIG